MQNLLPIFNKTVNTVCDDWFRYESEARGFTIECGRKGIARAHFFAVGLFNQDNGALPQDPGPFKLAAAFLVSGKHFFEFKYYPTKGRKEPTEDEKRLWKARFMVKCVTLFLLQLEMAGGKGKLNKVWDTPSNHYKLDFLNFIRWCEFPFSGPENPPPPNKPMVDMVRVSRLVMALSLIIEACYYLSGNEPKCDVLNKLKVTPADLSGELRPDLEY